MGKQNIPGIHNYCDRWCERCFFTSRCSIYENDGKSSPEDLDLKNKLFWERLSENFSKAKSILEQAAEKYGVNLDELQEDMQEAGKRSEENRIRMQQHPIIKMTREYVSFAYKWLKTQPGMMTRLENLKENLTMGVESQEEAKVQTETIKDALAVIQWYLTFLEPKFMRALMGKAENDWQTEDYDFQHDYDGSAKVGLIAIDRCMNAWISLFEILPEQEDEFLSVLSLLEKIKKAVLAEFPDAMKFVRPGFDEKIDL